MPMRSDLIISLELLRAISALLVLVHHMFLSWGAQEAGENFKSTIFYQLAWDLDLGKIGVMIFFLISGYLIPFTIGKHGFSSQKQFLQKRFLRIYPLFFVSVVVGCVFQIYGYHQSTSYSQFILNLLMVPNFFGREFVSGVFWTLQIEVFFYIIVASVVPWTPCLRTPQLIAVLIITLTSTAEALRTVSHEFFAIHELSKILGMLSFIFLGSLLRLWKEQRLGKIGTFTMYLFFCHEFIFRLYKFIQLESFTLAPKFSSFAGVIAIFVFIFALNVKKVPSFGLFLGKISYSIYLNHSLIIVVAVIALSTLEKNRYGLLLDLFYFAVVLAVTFLVSTFTYRFIERRFIHR
jgi:peptidoglycan/LPS O-acetylase OafA/YrhL